MPVRSPSGLYDSRIVCLSCEAQFGPWDTYGIEFLRRSLTEFDLLMSSGSARAYAPKEFNYHRFKLFVLSLLWRAHAAGHPFWSNVRLGPFAETLRNRILSADPGSQHDFPVYLARYEGTLGPMVESPTRTKPAGVNGYLFHFAMHDIICCVDSRTPQTSWFTEFALSPDRPPAMLVSPLIGGPKTTKLYRTAAKLREVEKTWRKTPRYLRDLRTEGIS
jgi:hypothetical protein